MIELKVEVNCMHFEIVSYKEGHTKVNSKKTYAQGSSIFLVTWHIFTECFPFGFAYGMAALFLKNYEELQGRA